MLFFNYLRQKRGIAVDTAGENRNTAIAKILNMPDEQVLKVLIFMAGMEAGEKETDAGRQQRAGAG